MKRKGLYSSVAALAVVGGATYALADLSYTQGSGTTIFDFVCFTSKHCGAHATITSTGGELFSPGTTPGSVNKAQVAGTAVTAVPSQYGVASTSTGTVENVNAFMANASDEPCLNKKTNVSFSSTATNTALVAAATNAKIYICSFSVLTSSASAVSILEGPTAACTSSSTLLAAVIGSTTASHGLSFPDSGGMTYGSGIASVAATLNTSTNLCLVQSGTGTLAGNISIVQTSSTA